MQRLVASSWAPWALLAATGVLHVLATLAGSDPFLMVDLAVYVDGARHLTDGTCRSPTHRSPRSSSAR